MKDVLKLEELAMCLASVVALYILDAPWYAYLALVLAPDISMLGYLGGNRLGALTYNFFHHKATGILMVGLGFYFENLFCAYAGFILFGHSALDRIFGYGLKYKQGFSFTHLGRIGKNRED